MSAGATALSNRDQPRVLIVEDEPMLAFTVEELLLDAGFEIAGVVGRLAAALALIEGGTCDVAIVDANLAGVSAGPAASALAARGVPFIVLSGYLPEQQQGIFPGAIFIQKPYRADQLIRVWRGILSDSES
jgi:DNA-binding response OmpR family regulator